MGCPRELDVVSPFVKLEVVPSTSNPGKIHLLCSYNNKYLEVARHRSDTNVLYVSATADRSVEDLNLSTSTLFTTKMNLPKGGVAFYHDASRAHVEIDPTNGVAIVSSPTMMQVFDFSPWESYPEKVGPKNEEIRRLGDALARFTESSDGGESISPAVLIRELRQVIAEQDRQLEELYDQIGGGGGGRKPVVKPAVAAGSAN
ncbi:unnamed protein product [Linum tenue]|uniref:Uncharacterized protein n=1 Tax=Linum tenue TaxID=586396 RepID=A0AAV0KGC9_9ROSI|nr:unnamed protein product [Linum tenue]